ncbi:MAG: nicotinate (nicotinamide) nucleotide adenylyltransferase [Desulfobacteraceae bacterium]|nr:nicotinate (nicotinamide) nucleotide adenylyltransferase [Desulfobacteraceae bacterium]
MNTGLFGGTFNPLHNGHIATIKYVADKFALKQVVFIPCAIPPHKNQQDLASAKDRFDIVNQSLNKIPEPYNFCASDIELKRKGPSFTIDTVKEFEKIADRKKKFFLILGSDAFLDIQTWKNFKEIFDEICVIIMLRRQKLGDKKLIEKIKSCIENNISNKYKLNSTNDKFIHTTKKDIFIAYVPKINISSTMIRKLIKQGDSIKNLAPSVVAKQIHDKGLYL